MPTEPTWQDFYDVGLAALQSRRPSLIVIQGDVTDAILAGAASMATAVIAFAAAKFRACFLDGAEGDDLTVLAHDRGVDRDTGDLAVGTVAFTRVSFAAGAGTITAGTQIASATDATGAFSTYTTDHDVIFGPTDLTHSVTATCTKIDVHGNVAIGQVTRIIDATFDPSITVVNAAAFAGGQPSESDPDLRDRVRGFFLTQARGTILALIFGAKTTPGVSRVAVTVDSSGVVTVYVTDADGNGNQALADAARAILEDWRDAADVVYVTFGDVSNQAIDLTLTVVAGVDIPALLDRVRQAVISRLQRLNPGDTLYRDAIAAAARAVDQDGIVSVRVNSPPVDLAAATPAQIFRTNTGLVTFS